MPIYAIGLVCSADSDAAFVGGANSYVSVWLTNYTAWEPDGDLTQDNQPPDLLTAADDPNGLGKARHNTRQLDG